MSPGLMFALPCELVYLFTGELRFLLCTHAPPAPSISLLLRGPNVLKITINFTIAYPINNRLCSLSMGPSPQAIKKATSTAEALSTFDRHPEPSGKYPYTPCPGYPSYTIRDVAKDEEEDYVMLKLHEDSDEGRFFASLIENGPATTPRRSVSPTCANMRTTGLVTCHLILLFIQLEGKRYIIKIKSPEGRELHNLLQPGTGRGNREHWHHSGGMVRNTMLWWPNRGSMLIRSRTSVPGRFEHRCILGTKMNTTLFVVAWLRVNVRSLQMAFGSATFALIGRYLGLVSYSSSLQDNANGLEHKWVCRVAAVGNAWLGAKGSKRGPFLEAVSGRSGSRFL